MAPETPVKSDNPAAGTPPTSPGDVDISFPPDEEAVSTLIGYCDKGLLPAYFGKDVPLEKYNDWLLNKEDGLRVSYDMAKQRVLLREGCYQSHGTTRLKLMFAMEVAFAGHGYISSLGQIATPHGEQNITPDAYLNSAPGTYPVLAEVGQSQRVADLNARANILLRVVPGAQVVILVKIFDTTDAENGRMVAWCATHDEEGDLDLTDDVEFGRVGPGAAPALAWVAGTPSPFITVPAHNAVPATNVMLDGILLALRGNNGANWKHAPPP